MKYYKKLRMKMIMDGITQETLAELMELSTCTISNYFTGRIEWRLSQVYKVCDVLEIPYSEISNYFPKDGMDVWK
jgi:transcriptional regulator with XRE-family HTH domain